MKPTIGRIVHYVETRPDQFGIEKAAIISAVGTGLDMDTVDLHVFQPLATVKHDGPAYEPVTAVGRVPFNYTSKEPGSWHWPEREE
jgi:hypothetical protein